MGLLWLGILVGMPGKTAMPSRPAHRHYSAGEHLCRRRERPRRRALPSAHYGPMVSGVPRSSRGDPGAGGLRALPPALVWTLPLALATGVVAVSFAAIFIRLCDDAPAVVIAAARMTLATALLAPLVAARGPRAQLAGLSRHLPAVAAAGAFLAAHFFFWITSLKHTSVLSSVVIVTTNPIFLGIAGYVLFGERLGRSMIAAIAIGCAGGALIAFADAGGETGSLRGDLAALAGALMASGYMLIGRRVRAHVPLLGYITAVNAVAAGLLLALALLTGHSFTGLRPSTYLYFLLLALVPQIIGHGSFNWALRYTTATTVSVFILGEPVGATILAWWLLDEAPGWLPLVGAGLVLCAIFLAARSLRASPRVLEPPAG